MILVQREISLHPILDYCIFSFYFEGPAGQRTTLTLEDSQICSHWLTPPTMAPHPFVLSKTGAAAGGNSEGLLPSGAVNA